MAIIRWKIMKFTLWCWVNKNIDNLSIIDPSVLISPIFDSFLLVFESVMDEVKSTEFWVFRKHSPPGLSTSITCFLFYRFLCMQHNRLLFCWKPLEKCKRLTGTVCRPLSIFEGTWKNQKRIHFSRAIFKWHLL